MKKIVLLGDSIRLIGYGTKIKDYLKGYDVIQPDDNTRFSKYLLRILFEWQEQLKTADLVTFNAGIWDASDLFHDGIFLTPIDEYVSTMERVADIILKFCPNAIFLTSTPILDGQEHCKDQTIREYNSRVVPILKKKGIKIIDLYSFVNENKEEYIRNDDLIHLTDKGIDETAKYIAAIIKENI